MKTNPSLQTMSTNLGEHRTHAETSLHEGAIVKRKVSGKFQGMGNDGRLPQELTLGEAPAVEPSMPTPTPKGACQTECGPGCRSGHTPPGGT